MYRHRLDRRMRILRGKRDGAFDPQQYYLEAAVRARTARKVRHLLRRNEPIVLVTPRWSSAQRFLDDVAVDLLVGSPAVHCRTLSIAPLKGRKIPEAWGWLVQAFTEFLELYLDGPVWQAVSRHGFRHVIGELLMRAQKGSRRALLMHGVEHMPVEVRDDLLEAFTEYRRRVGDRQRLNLLVALSVDAPSVELADAHRVHLHDYGSDETIEALVEYTGPTEKKRLRIATRLSGGVPALVEALGTEAERRGALPGNGGAMARIVEPLLDEMRAAMALAETEPALAERLERLALLGPQPYDGDLDTPLVHAGLARVDHRGRRPHTQVRTPLLREIVSER